MIEFKLKNKDTNKTESYSKECITLAEAERFYDYMEKREKETEKEVIDSRKLRKMERQYMVSLFEAQGLTEEDVLNYMSTKQYSKTMDDIFREISGQDEADTEDEASEVGKDTE